MKPETIVKSPSVLPFTLLVACGLLPACLGAAQDQQPPDSPILLLGRLQEAERSQNYGDALREVPSNDREACVYMLWYGAAYDAIGAEPQVVREYQEILDEYLLDEDWLNRDATGPDGLRRVAAETLADQPLEELFADLISFNVRHGRFGYAFGFLNTFHELDVGADQATALIGESKFTFVRSDGTWYWRFLDFDAPAGDS